MRHYEIVALVHPDHSEQVDQMVARYQQLIEDDGGKIHRYENWGRRRLAYQIQKLYKANYFLLNVECTPEIKDELENQFRFNDSILRSLVIRMEKAETEDSPIMTEIIKKREEEARITAESEAAAAPAPKPEVKSKRDDSPAKKPEAATAAEAPSGSATEEESVANAADKPAETAAEEPETKNE